MAKKKQKTSTKAQQSAVNKGKNKPSTQQYLPFSQIRDDLVIMRDGTLRSVLLVSSLNFALKSEDEQKGIIQGYVGFLNTIDFELQIIIQSRKLNIEKYLEQLKILARNQENELLRKQTMSYRSFISRLVEEADIMDKKFFVIIPYSPFSRKKKNFWQRAQQVLSPTSAIKLNQAKMEQYKVELNRRIGVALSGLQSVGLQVQRLDTQALIELYYNTYNPVTKQQKQIEDIRKMQVEYTTQ